MFGRPSVNDTDSDETSNSESDDSSSSMSSFFSHVPHYSPESEAPADSSTEPSGHFYDTPASTSSHPVEMTSNEVHQEAKSSSDNMQQ